MIIIKKGTINQIDTTLFEKKKSATDIYLVQFIDSGNNSFFCLATDLSNTTRFNRFCITEISGGTPDPLQAQIKLNVDGQYEYIIYESPDSSLDPTGLHRVEIGRLLVLEDETKPPAYSPEKPKLTFYNKNK